MKEKKIKLLTLWQRKSKYNDDDYRDDLINGGIWEVIGMKDLDTKLPIAVMRCQMQ
jgi:hypothetical protein